MPPVVDHGARRVHSGQSRRMADCWLKLPPKERTRQPSLIRCFTIPFDTGGIWIVYHERLRRSQPIRFLVEKLARYASGAIARGA